MFSKYIRITAMLLCLCLLTACAGPVEGPAAAAPAEKEAEQSAAAEVAAEPEPDPTAEPWAGYAINSPEMAEETVRAEIAKMQELGILSDKLYISEGPADAVYFFTEPEFLDRTDRPCYGVRWYCDSWYGNNWEGEDRYSVSANLDAQSGKIMYISIEAAADENAEVVYTVPQTEYDPETGKSIETGEDWLYHENFSDIFDVEMSTNTFCDLLNEYWGFDGWSLGGGGALNLEVPLIDLTAGTTGYYYVAFSFEGDEEGKHMYVQLNEFPGRVNLMFGTSHAVG